MPSRILSSTLVKDSKRRAQRQIENEVFEFDYAEPHPVFDIKSKILKKFSNLIMPSPILSYPKIGKNA